MLANVALPAFMPHSLATLAGIFVIAAIEGWFLMRVLKLNYADSYRHSLDKAWRNSESRLIHDLPSPCKDWDIPLYANLYLDLRRKWNCFN